MKIGTAVQVLPLCHPLQLAEEAATVDQISHGRLIFGVGRSGFPRTYQAYGVSYAESRERFVEVLEILKRAWTQERFSFDGQVLPLRRCLPGAEALPEAVSGDPRRRDQPRHLPGERRAGATRSSVATRLGDLSELGPNLKAYREAWTAAGHPGNGEVFLRVPVYVAATEERRAMEPEESVMHFYRYLGERHRGVGAAGRRARDREPRRARPASAVDRLRRGAGAARSSSARRRRWWTG